jgi:FkbM family methyltransferase
VTFAAADRELFQRLARIDKAPNVVYDIGASDGWWSANVSDKLPPAVYHLFEPLSAHEAYREALNDHLNMNPTWRLHSIALGDRNGSIQMSVGHSPYDSTTVNMSWYTSGFGSQIEVPQYRLDD